MLLAFIFLAQTLVSPTQVIGSGTRLAPDQAARLCRSGQLAAAAVRERTSVFVGPPAATVTAVLLLDSAAPGCSVQPAETLVLFHGFLPIGGAPGAVTFSLGPLFTSGSRLVIARAQDAAADSSHDLCPAPATVTAAGLECPSGWVLDRARSTITILPGVKGWDVMLGWLQ